MGRAKEIIVRVIPSNIANPFIRRHHYSGKVVNNSVLHFGCFLDGRLHGVLSYGPSMDKSKIVSLVEGTGWNEFLELNRMAFDEYLPRNSESYCIGKTLRMIKRNAPQIKWVISFADGCSCGDGTIYRASNFVLTGIRENKNLCQLPSGEKIHKMTLESNPTSPRPELGGKSYYDVTGGRFDFRRYVDYVGGGDSFRIPVAIYLFYRQRRTAASYGAGNSIQPYRRARRWHVQGRTCDAIRTARHNDRDAIGRNKGGVV